MKKYIMALDQGTTSSRCIIFDTQGNCVSSVSREFPGIFPKEGWVEQDPLAIWSTQISVAIEALLKAGGTWENVYGIGITNQRETTIVWDRNTGEPIYNAIVWQCRRTAPHCDELIRAGKGQIIREKTGLIVDPYFSATKISWILENVPGAKEKATMGELCFGTVDSWLIWNLTGGKIHATDPSNAARTMLYNINTLEWDEELLELFSVPRSMLPEVKPSSGIFGYTDPKLFGHELPIAGVAGDQQSALFGQCCFDEGEIKNTYGTGAFLLMNTGESPTFSDKGLITTVAWSIGGRTTYALEGSVFTCGAAIQWLRDSLKIIDSAQESEHYARVVEDSGGVMVVPAFQGLGAPWWDPYARGMIIGITRATTKNHIIRATLEAIAYQTADVVRLMEDSTGSIINELKVDGGASANDLLMEMQADILGVRIKRPKSVETTALGAAYLTGLALGVYESQKSIKKAATDAKLFSPSKDEDWRTKHIKEWQEAVKRTLGYKQ